MYVAAYHGNPWAAVRELAEFAVGRYEYVEAEAVNRPSLMTAG
jgi:hypothetical protein